MGERTDDVRDIDSPENLEQEVEDIRDNMTDIVGELDRRRHEVLDWRLQLRRRAGPLAMAAVGLVILVGSAAGLSIWRRRRRNRPVAKARRLRDALSRMIAHPELVAQPHPSIAKKALAAAASAAAARLAKTITERLAASRVETR
jgi:hypothetical protein